MVKFVINSARVNEEGGNLGSRKCAASSIFLSIVYVFIWYL